MACDESALLCAPLADLHSRADSFCEALGLPVADASAHEDDDAASSREWHSGASSTVSSSVYDGRYPLPLPADVELALEREAARTRQRERAAAEAEAAADALRTRLTTALAAAAGVIGVALLIARRRSSRSGDATADDDAGDNGGGSGEPQVLALHEVRRRRLAVLGSNGAAPAPAAPAPMTHSD